MRPATPAPARSRCLAGPASGERARHTGGWSVQSIESPTTTEGRFHRLDSEVRGWGQRDFPRYHDTVDPDPIDMPVEERLIDELAAVLRENGVASDPPPTTP